jgi:hypothetical protein
MGSFGVQVGRAAAVATERFDRGRAQALEVIPHVLQWCANESPVHRMRAADRPGVCRRRTPGRLDRRPETSTARLDLRRSVAGSH